MPLQILTPVILSVAVAASVWHSSRHGTTEAARYARPAIAAPPILQQEPVKSR